MPRITPNHGRAPRAPGHDQTRGRWYFVTLVLDPRIPLLASVRGGYLRLTDEGKLVKHAWRDSARIRHEVFLGRSVVMPDHFHALVGIRKRNDPPSETRGCIARPRVGRTVGSLIAGFKAASTGSVNRHRGTPGKRLWQLGYYDRIVR